MFLKKIFVLFGITLSCFSQMGGCNDRSPSGNTTSFQTVEKGTNSLYQVSITDQVKALIFKSQQEWQDFWTVHNGGQAATYDFTRQRLAAVILSIRPTGGYGLEIKRIATAESVVNISVEETVPGLGCVVTQASTTPFHIIVFDSVVNNAAISSFIAKTVPCQ